MTRLFTRERFGRPQFLAGALLLAFLAQAIWLVRSELRSSDGPSAPEQARIAAGWRQFHGGGIAGAPFPDPPGSLPVEISQNGAFDTQHSPLLSLVTAAPFLAWPQRLLNQEFSPYWRWLPRLPFLACGMALGASLWYVARRLCGNSGGFLALTLYCFSPSMIQASAVWHTEPEILAAWGSFGAIFTAIAVAHTLYAPREVVLWNWRRIVLLGVSLAIAVGSQFSMIVVVPLALGFLLYLAPIRRGAALTIWTAACFVALAIFFATYFFHPHAFSEAMRHASFWGATWRSFTRLRRLPPGRTPNPARLSRLRSAPARRHHYLSCLASHPLLRQHRSRPCRPPADRPGYGPSQRRWRGISSRFHPLPPHFRLRRPRRPHGNSLSPTRHRLRLRTTSRLHPLEPPGTIPYPPRMT